MICRIMLAHFTDEKVKHREFKLLIGNHRVTTVRVKLSHWHKPGFEIWFNN